MGKTNWFRSKKKTTKTSRKERIEKDKNEPGDWKRVKKRMQNEEDSRIFTKDATKTAMKGDRSEKELMTAAVLFVPTTKDGLLAKNIREVVERVRGILGYRIEVIER